MTLIAPVLLTVLLLEVLELPSELVQLQHDVHAADHDRVQVHVFEENHHLPTEQHARKVADRVATALHHLKHLDQFVDSVLHVNFYAFHHGLLKVFDSPVYDFQHVLVVLTPDFIEQNLFFQKEDVQLYAFREVFIEIRKAWQYFPKGTCRYLTLPNELTNFDFLIVDYLVSVDGNCK